VYRSNAQGALVETPKAPRGGGCGEGCPLPRVSPPSGEGVWEGARPLSRIFLLSDLKVEHFGAKLDLTKKQGRSYKRRQLALLSAVV